MLCLPHQYSPRIYFVIKTEFPPSETKFPYWVYDKSLSPQLYSLSYLLWSQSDANWTLINQSQVTKIGVDNLINIVHLLL